MDYQIFLPSKKIMIIGALLAIFIGWLFWVPTTDIFKLKNLGFGKKSPALATAQNPVTALDSDSDGLKDWEETLWHTDPRNPDTDHDGTPDGEEVRLGRDPLTPGPNDDLKTIALERAASSTIQAANKNLTETVSTELMTALINAKGKSGAVDGLPQQLIDKNMPPPFQDEFTIGDIAVSGDNSKPAVKNYLNTIATIIWDELKQTNDVNAILLSVDSNPDKPDYSLLDKLSANTTAYSNILEEVKKLKAPSTLSLTHLEIINTANNARKAIIELQQLNSDPLVAIHGWREYSNAEQQSKDIIRALNAMINSQAINLTRSDHGYIFKLFNDQLQ